MPAASITIFAVVARGGFLFLAFPVRPSSWRRTGCARRRAGRDRPNPSQQGGLYQQRDRQVFWLARLPQSSRRHPTIASRYPGAIPGEVRQHTSRHVTAEFMIALFDACHRHVARTLLVSLRHFVRWCDARKLIGRIRPRIRLKMAKSDGYTPGTK